MSCRSLVAILTCRFLLALQSANQKALGQHATGTLSMGDGDENGDTLQFASRVLGSIGASLPGESVVSVLDGGQEADLEDELAAGEKVAQIDEGQIGQAPPDVHGEIQTVSYRLGYDSHCVSEFATMPSAGLRRLTGLIIALGIAWNASMFLEWMRGDTGSG